MSDSVERDGDRATREPRRVERTARVRTARSSGTPFGVYKPGQGKAVRWGAAAGAGVLALAFAAFLFDQLGFFPETVRFLIPVAALTGLGILLFRYVGQDPPTVDFLVATEGEMKKVNWSTRREVLGATRVVIVLILVLGFLLFFIDLLFIFFFEVIGVLRLGMLGKMFGGLGG